MDVISKKWYEESWFQNMIGQLSTVLILAIVTFGALKPLLNRILVPSAGVAGAPGGASEADLEAEEAEDEVQVQEGESLEDIKAKLKPKKSTISADMLDTANTYDDKVAVIRMIVGDEAGKVSNVFRQLMKKRCIIIFIRSIQMAEKAKEDSKEEEEKSQYEQLTSTQKCAILMMLLGEEEASEILKNLGPKEVQQLGKEMYNVQGLDQDTVNRVLDEFLAIIKTQTDLGMGSTNYIRNVMTKALGENKGTISFRKNNSN